MLDVAAAAFGKYYVEVIERQRPKLWLAKVTDRQTDGRTDKRAYRLTKLTWLAVLLVALLYAGGSCLVLTLASPFFPQRYCAKVLFMCGHAFGGPNDLLITMINGL